MRVAWFVAAMAWLTPVLSVGVHAFGASALPSLLIGVALAAAAAHLVAPRLAEAWAPARQLPGLSMATLLFAAAAVVQIARLSVYMGDPARTDYSYRPSDPWRTEHCCMTAYAEAARFAADRAHDIYDASLYTSRRMGPLTVDSYHYPPPFLLLPAAVRAVRPEFFQVRALWFTMQALILAGALLGTARWIGARPGAYALAGSVLLLATPQILFSLQQGNFQITAVPVALVGFRVLCAGRTARGAPLLAFTAAAKIFPGILVVYLAASRRWAAVVWTAVCGVALLGLTVLAFGQKPIVDFVRDELPRISSGAAFPQSERPSVISSNQSVYGQTVRLRSLGLSFLDARRGRAVASLYGVAVIVLAAFAGWRQRVVSRESPDRMRLVQTGLALVSLASFRSPFVGFYGLVGTVWLMSLLTAEASGARALMLGWLGLGMFCLACWLVPSPAYPATTWSLAGSGLIMTVVLLINIFVVMRAGSGLWQLHAGPADAPVLQGAAR